MTAGKERKQLIRDLQQFVDELGKTPTKTELNEDGPHYAKLYQQEFGSWNDALKAADLELNLVHNISRQEIRDDIERVAGVLAKTPTLNEMDEFGRFSRLTYQRKLDSYVETLEDLGFDPTIRQYNFSDQEKPPGLQATKNVRKLREDGPTAASDLPLNSTGASDKQYGLTKFSINTGRMGKEQSEPIYYLFEDHDPETVIRTYFSANPQVLENRTRKAITEAVGKYGKSWSEAVTTILDDLDVD